MFSRPTCTTGPAAPVTAGGFIRTEASGECRQPPTPHHPASRGGPTSIPRPIAFGEPSPVPPVRRWPPRPGGRCPPLRLLRSRSRFASPPLLRAPARWRRSGSPGSRLAARRSATIAAKATASEPSTGSMDDAGVDQAHPASVEARRLDDQLARRKVRARAPRQGEPPVDGFTESSGLDARPTAGEGCRAPPPWSGHARRPALEGAARVPSSGLRIVMPATGCSGRREERRR